MLELIPVLGIILLALVAYVFCVRAIFQSLAYFINEHLYFAGFTTAIAAVVFLLLPLGALYDAIVA